MRILLTLALVFISFFVTAQNFLSWKFNDRYFSATIGTGSATYFGELNYNNRINDRISLLNIGMEARLLSRIGARLEVAYLTLEGTDRDAPEDVFERQRNLSFESRNLHISLAGTYYFKQYSGEYHSRWTFDPYIAAGVGFLQYNPAAILGEERFLLREARTEEVAYNKWAFTIPMGVGAKFRVNDFVNVNVEVLYHLTFSDYLDDVSDSYGTEFSSSTAELLSDRKEEIGVINPTFYDQIMPGASRGNPSTNDGFLLINLKAEVFLPFGI